MKILMVYDIFYKLGGGSQLLVLHFIENLLRAGVEVKLLCNHNNVKLLLPKKDIIELKSVDLGLIKPKFSPGLFFDDVAKKKVLEFNPDLVHLNEPSLTTLPIIFFCRQNKIKVINFFHTNYSDINWFYRLTVWQYYLFLLSHSDAIFVPTKYWQRKLQKKVSVPVILQRYSIKKDFFNKNLTKKNSNPYKLLVVSRLTPEKKIEFLLDVMDLLRGKFVLDIVGDGPLKGKIIRKIEKLNLQKHVKLLGWVENSRLPGIFSSHDIFLSASSFETFGLTYVEALLNKLPCVVYDYPVSREVIPQGMGEFVSEYDPQLWAAKIANVANLTVYNQMLQNIKKNYYLLKTYHPNFNIEELIKNYQLVIDKY